MGILLMVITASMVLRHCAAQRAARRKKIDLSRSSSGWEEDALATAATGDGIALPVGARGVVVMPARPEPIRVALCFFGPTRSLRWTLPSIRSRIFDILKAGQVDYDTFVHTYSMREV